MDRHACSAASLSAPRLRRCGLAAVAVAPCRRRPSPSTPLVSAQWLKRPSGRSGAGRARRPLGDRRRRRGGLRQGAHPGRDAQRLRQGRLARDAQRRAVHAADAWPNSKSSSANSASTRTRHVVVVPAGVSATDFGSAARIYWTLKVAGASGGVDPRRRLRRLAGRGLSGRERHRARRRRKFSPRRSTSACSPKSRESKRSNERRRHAGRCAARERSSTARRRRRPSKAYGHIPGAHQSRQRDFYDPATNRLQAARQQLAAIAATLPAGPVVAYCNTGHWAATDWFVLSELLGRTDVRLYYGSMVDWTADAQPSGRVARAPSGTT